jgi:DNA-binding XRE family transcriptional regulator
MSVSKSRLAPGIQSRPGQHVFREIREGIGISQAVLAKKSGVSRAVIANVEVGRHGMSIDDSIAVCTALFRTPSLKPGAHKFREDAKNIALNDLARVRVLVAAAISDTDLFIEQQKTERKRLEAKLADLKYKEAWLKNPT